MIAIAVAVLLSAAVALVAARTSGPDTDLAYDWQPATVRGGGWVTGLVTHPEGAVYARTDVGGAYRWDDERSSWEQMLTAEAVPDPVATDYSVEALAVAPSDPEVVYLAVGGDVEAAEGSVLRSEDGGRSWRRSAERFTVDGNAEWRQGGARLAVDPEDPDVVWLGTRTEGLWTSEDGGQQWRQVSDLPAAVASSDSDPAGVTFVLPGGGEDGASSRGLWAGVEGVGVARSEDGGESWDVVHDTPGSIPRDAEVASDGHLYVAVQGESAGVVRLPPSGRSADVVTPGGAPAVVAVDPTNPARVFVGDEGVRDGYLWRSEDRGDSWTSLDVAIESSDAAWPEQSDLESYMSAGDLTFDPARPGELWFAEGMGAWRSGDLEDEEVTWTFTSNGIEELVSNDAVHPAGQALLTAHWDRAVVRHPPSAQAELPLTGRFNSAWSLAVAPHEPSFVAAVVDDRRDCCSDDDISRQSGYSEDGGRTWRRFGSIETGAHPDELQFGSIAVASGDVDNLVWVPSNGGKVHFSRDRGATWTPAEYPGWEPHFAYYLQRDALVADPDRPGTFFILDTAGVLQSTDGGATWTLREGQGLPPEPARRFNATLATVPDRPDELVLTTGVLDEGSYGIFHSRDAGDSWTELPGLSEVGRLAFGPAPQQGEPPLLFATGRRGNRHGLWRSDDVGSTWDHITPAPDGRYQDITVLAADPEAPGRVHVGFTGTGFLTGEPP